MERLDVRGYDTADVRDLIVDVIVRHPYAVRYQSGAALTDGYAAATAEEETQKTNVPPLQHRCCHWVEGILQATSYE